MLPTPDIGAEKQARRARQRERLGQLGAEERRARSEKLVTRLLAWPVWRKAERVLLFAPLAEEPDLDLLWTRDGLAGKTCAYPRVTGEEMPLVVVRNLADLQPARWGLREPAAAPEAEIALAKIDLVLVPGLAFDRDGGRLGRGGGFYDRLLAGRGERTFLLGVAFAFQIGAALPLTAHDVVVDAVMTDEESLLCFQAQNGH